MTTVELFSGAGLLSEGFKRAGFKTIFAAEADVRAVDTYNRNIHPVAVEWDVKEVRTDLKCDLLLAGPPCQGFSSLGRRDPNDERNFLSYKVVDWAIQTEARMVVIENVPQYLESIAWTGTRTRMEALGYKSTTWILDAADYGVPQNRLRVFAIFSKIGLPECPVKSDVDLTVRDAFANLPVFKNPIMDAVPDPTELALSRFTRIPERGDKRDLMKSSPELCPPSWAKMGIQATGVWGRMDFDKPANTLRTCFQNPSKGRYIHPVENRVMTLREGARLQGIPDDWVFVGDRTSIARQIGNGVPVPLAQAVARSVSEVFRRVDNLKALHPDASPLLPRRLSHPNGSSLHA